ncbi:hypothetical protein CYMTET_19726 [Cymbomonas tetramitiformis]|uniref:Uncharacterized protein n=1 Tax=Cymbomonas tetramitiformis TaxID=36881 RepID=A0AAE0L4K9_9CHLO|nr:hypothetical protein CYMTET_19726 [Cymbomonas tetramitiformis]
MLQRKQLVFETFQTTHSRQAKFRRPGLAQRTTFTKAPAENLSAPAHFKYRSGLLAPKFPTLNDISDEPTTANAMAVRRSHTPSELKARFVRYHGQHGVSDSGLDSSAFLTLPSTDFGDARHAWDKKRGRALSHDQDDEDVVEVEGEDEEVTVEARAESQGVEVYFVEAKASASPCQNKQIRDLLKCWMGESAYPHICGGYLGKDLAEGRSVNYSMRGWADGVCLGEFGEVQASEGISAERRVNLL